MYLTGSTQIQIHKSFIQEYQRKKISTSPAGK